MLTFVRSKMGEKGEEEDGPWNADTWDANRCEHWKWIIKTLLDVIRDRN